MRHGVGLLRGACGLGPGAPRSQRFGQQHADLGLEIHRHAGLAHVLQAIVQARASAGVLVARDVHQRQKVGARDAQVVVALARCKIEPLRVRPGSPPARLHTVVLEAQCLKDALDHDIRFVVQHCLHAVVACLGFGQAAHAQQQARAQAPRPVRHAITDEIDVEGRDAVQPRQRRVAGGQPLAQQAGPAVGLRQRDVQQRSTAPGVARRVGHVQHLPHRMHVIVGRAAACLQHARMGKVQQLRQARVGCGGLRQRPGDELRHLLRRDAAAPTHKHDAASRQRAELARLLGFRLAFKQRHHLAPGGNDLRRVASAQPLRGAHGVASSQQPVTPLLAVVRHQRCQFASTRCTHVALLHDLSHPRVHALRAGAQLRGVGAFLNQRMSEVQASAVRRARQQLGRAQAPQRPGQRARRRAQHARQHRGIDLLADDGASLQHALVGGGQGIDAGGDQAVDAVGQFVGPARRVGAGAAQVARQFFGKERVALAALGHAVDPAGAVVGGDGGGARAGLGQRRQPVGHDAAQRRRRQRTQRQHGGVRQARPRRRAAALVDQQQRVGVGHRLGHGGQDGAAGGIKPVQVVHHQQAQAGGVGAHQLRDERQQAHLARIAKRRQASGRRRVVVGHAHQLVQQEGIDRAGLAGLGQRGVDAAARLGRRQVGRAVEAQRAEQLARRAQGQRVAQGVGLHAHHAHAGAFAALREFGAQARLAQAGVAADAHHLPLAGARATERMGELRQLIGPAQKTPASAGDRGHGGAGHVQPQREQRHRLQDALEVPGADRPRGQQAGAQQVARVVGQQHLAGVGLGGDATGQVNGHAVRAAAAPVAGFGRVAGDLAGVDADAQRQARAAVVTLRAGHALHLHRRQAGLLGVLLERARHAEQRHDAVAQRAQHRAAVLLDHRHHALDGGLQLAHGLLGAQLGDLTRGIDDVGKQDGGGLDLAPGGGRGAERLAAGGAKAVGVAAVCPAMGAKTATAHVQPLGAGGHERLTDNAESGKHMDGMLTAMAYLLYINRRPICIGRKLERAAGAALAVPMEIWNETGLQRLYIKREQLSKTKRYQRAGSVLSSTSRRSRWAT